MNSPNEGVLPVVNYIPTSKVKATDRNSSSSSSLRSQRRRSDASSPWWQSKTTLNAPASFLSASVEAADSPLLLATLSSHMLLPISIDRLILTNDDKSRVDNQDRWANNKHHQQILINSQSLQLLWYQCNCK